MSYKEKFVAVYDNQKSRMDEKFKKYCEKGLPNNPMNLYSMTSSNLEVLAVGEYVLNNDVGSMKNYFFNAAIAQEKAIKYFDAHDDAKAGGFVSMLSYRELFYSIISDSVDLQIRYANLMGGRNAIDRLDTDEYTYNWGYALKYAVLGDDNLALMHVDKLNDSKRQHFSKCLRAIIQKNENEVNELLCEIIKKHRTNKSNKNTTQELLCTAAIALAKLAINKGIVVDIDDVIAPKEIIDNTKVDYYLVDIVKLFVS